MRMLFPILLLLTACNSDAGSKQKKVAESAADEFRQCVLRSVAPYGGREHVTGEQANAAFSACQKELDRAADESAKASPNYRPNGDNRFLAMAAKQMLIAYMSSRICDRCLPPI